MPQLLESGMRHRDNDHRAAPNAIGNSAISVVLVELVADAGKVEKNIGLRIKPRGGNGIR